MTHTVVQCVAGGRSYTDSAHGPQSLRKHPWFVCAVCFPQSVYTESLFADITTEDLIAV